MQEAELKWFGLEFTDKVKGWPSVLLEPKLLNVSCLSPEPVRQDSDQPPQMLYPLESTVAPNTFVPVANVLRTETVTPK